MGSLFRAFMNKINSPADPKASFAGRTVIVTGSNTGIGFEAAVKFAALGAEKVILAVRSPDKGKSARSAISRRSSRKDSDCVEVWPLDMLSYASIRTFATRVNSELPRLDIAVLNAGAIFKAFDTSDYGNERTLQVNTLSTILLALHLIPKLRASKTPDFTPVLELVSSGSHRLLTWSEIETASSTPLTLFNDPAHPYRRPRQYGSSKLFLMCAVPHLVSLCAHVPNGSGIYTVAEGSNGEPDVSLITVCPGMTASDLWREMMKWWMRPLLWILTLLFVRTAEEGSRTYISGVLLGSKAQGGFWQHDELRERAPLLDGPEGQARCENVWHEIIDNLRKDNPEVLDLIKR